MGPKQPKQSTSHQPEGSSRLLVVSSRLAVRPATSTFFFPFTFTTRFCFFFQRFTLIFCRTSRPQSNTSLAVSSCLHGVLNPHILLRLPAFSLPTNTLSSPLSARVKDPLSISIIVQTSYYRTSAFLAAIRVHNRHWHLRKYIQTRRALDRWQGCERNYRAGSVFL